MLKIFYYINLRQKEIYSKSAQMSYYYNILKLKHNMQLHNFQLETMVRTVIYYWVFNPKALLIFYAPQLHAGGIIQFEESVTKVR